MPQQTKTLTRYQRGIFRSMPDDDWYSAAELAELVQPGLSVATLDNMTNKGYLDRKIDPPRDGLTLQPRLHIKYRRAPNVELEYC